MRNLKTIESIAHEMRLRGPQGRGDGWISFEDIYSTGWDDFTASWEHYGYRRVGDRVEIALVAARSSGTSLTIATLPEGFRPEFSVMRVGVQATDSPCRVDIRDTGAINMHDVTGTFSFVSISCDFYSPINRR